MKSVKAIIENQQTATVAPSTSVLDAAIMMARRGIGAVPVVEGDRLAGIFTERDVLTRVVAAGVDPAGTCVLDVESMTHGVADVRTQYDVILQRVQQAR